MSKIEITLLAAAFLCTAAWGNEIRFEDGFESGLKEWHIPGSRAAVTITGTAATGGKAAEIRFDPKRNPEKRHCGVLRSRKIPVSRGLYRVTGKIQLAEGYGATVGIEFYDAKNRKIGDNGFHYGSAPVSTSAWLDVDFRGGGLFRRYQLCDIETLHPVPGETDCPAG